LFDTALAERWRLVALDLPGCGDSGPLDRYSIRGLADVIVEYARVSGCEDALFIGHSLGGHLLLEAAPRLSRARGFAIFGTPPLGNPPRLEEAFLPSPALALAFKPDLTAAEMRTLIGILAGPAHPAAPMLEGLVRRNDPRMRDDLGRSLAGLAYADEVERVRTLGRPLAVLHGGRDALVNGQYLAGLSIPTLWRGAVQTIAEAGHYAQLDRPQELARLLRDFAHEVDQPE
jgi:pimeloyl-ACP methyl ester carboxylesterase